MYKVTGVNVWWLRGGRNSLAGPVLARPLFGDQVINIQKSYVHMYIVRTWE